MSQRHFSTERLKSRRSIGQLFGPDGRSVAAYPLRVLYRREAGGEMPFGVRAAFVVPKKRFKSAVRRNLLKRRMLEAYRLNKAVFAGTQERCTTEQLQCHLLFMYTGKEAMPYAAIERKMRKLLVQLDGILSQG
ncbi:ribonuclease P protein component [Neolewinella xylanilytica]|uniref:Ribonuclease P protein component n=1 Tax=Neolewinella xylanilytica TaxID=1514080 RepID=A0A2S6I2Q8_9BACT|nr:ribonuclease P protein component [Neolewinella xylanilytica]PPK85443.1 ribonuclease P protein component [Neolewinella xylanilytica]